MSDPPTSAPRLTEIGARDLRHHRNYRDTNEYAPRGRVVLNKEAHRSILACVEVAEIPVLN
jgi:hypothetical protein